MVTNERIRSSAGREQENRSRTFTGCRTCRDRHLKCDEAKPACLLCCRLGVECEGYAPHLLWMTPQRHLSRSQSQSLEHEGPQHKPKGSSYRFPLFDETVRESLSQELTESLGKQSAGGALMDLDGIPISSDDRQLHLAGPFGVFRAFDDPSLRASTTIPTVVANPRPTSVDDGIDDSSPRQESGSPLNDAVDAQQIFDDNAIICDDFLDSWQEETSLSHTDAIHRNRLFPGQNDQPPPNDFGSGLALEAWQRHALRSSTINTRHDQTVNDSILLPAASGHLSLSPFTMDFGGFDLGDWALDPQLDDGMEHTLEMGDNIIRRTRLTPWRGNSPLHLPTTMGTNAVDESAETSNPPIQRRTETMVGRHRGTCTDFNSRHNSEMIPRSLSRPGNATLPLHADTLLRYLKEEVLSNASHAFPSRISPRKELLLPCGLETYAEISLWHQSSHTRLSILYTLLAKSAFHLHKSHVGRDSQLASHWLDIAVSHQRDGQEHLKRALMSLQDESSGSERIRYSETLMAILGVGFVMIYFNRPTAVKKILVDAERFIRLRGIPSSKKSYRLRVLHHMYTHLRVIMESTNVSFTLTQASTNPASPILNPITNPFTSRELIAMPVSRFRIAKDNLGQLDPGRDKPDDVGYNDIHLQVPGHWRMTMYPEMYGIPESLMNLHAQTICLVNEKSRLEQAAQGDPAVAVALQKHIQTLEQQIWSWKKMGPEKPPPGPSSSSSSPHSSCSSSSSPNGDMLVSASDGPPISADPDFSMLAQAIQQALIIYFYRRVYNMSAMIMQNEVRKTLDCIQPYLEVQRYDQDFAITIGWVLFLAACEAVTPDLQKRSMECLEVIDNCGIFVETAKPSTTARAVWKKREECGDLSFSWLDLMV